MRRNLILTLSLMPVLIVSINAVQQQSVTDLFHQAVHLEEVKGDLQAAIPLYQRVARESSDHSLAAKAQLQVGTCYERLGLREARAAYQRVIDSFPEQRREVRLARERIAALSAAVATVSDRPMFKKIRMAANLDLLSTPQLSPDGQRLAYASGGEIWIVPVAGNVSPDLAGVPVELPGVERAQNPLAWSGDGRWIAYNRTTPGGTLANEMCIVDSSGGLPRQIPFDPVRAVNISFRISLSPDGSVLAFVHQPAILPPLGGIYTISVHGGIANRLTAADRPSFSPAFSPDGRKIAFVRDDNNVWVIEAGGSAPVQVSNLGTALFPIWSPDGTMIAFVRWFGTGYTSQMCIFRLTGDRGLISEPTVINLPQRASTRLAGWTTDNQIGIMMMPEEKVALFTVPASGGKPAQLTDGGRPMSPKWSPDGSKIFFLSHRREDPTSQYGYIASVPSEGGEESRVPVPAGKEFYAAWQLDLSPDGREIAFSGSKFVGDAGSYGGYRLDIYKVPVGGGDITQLTFGGRDRNPCWSPDGNSIVFVRQERQEAKSDLRFRADILTVPVNGGQPVQLTSCNPDSRPRWSHNGNLIAYLSEERTINVIPPSAGTPRIVADADSGSDLSWSPDGSEIAYVSGGKLWVAPLVGGNRRVITTGSDAIPSDLSWSRDGRRIAYAASWGGDPELWLMQDFLPLVR